MSELYIVKNALRCISRSKGRNILIGIIVLVISVSACIGLAIRQAAQSTREDTLSQMSVTATISFDRQSMMSDMTGGEKFDKSQFSQMMGNASALTPVISATYVFDDTDSYYRFEDEVREMGLSDSYSVSSQDITSFESSLVPLDTLSTMAGWFLLVLLIIGAVILVVLNIFNVRERKYEIGVLTAMGMKKRCVAMQFLCEIFAVTLASVIIGLTIGAVSALPVANALLENQISSSEAQNTQTEKNFGRGEPGAAVPGDIPDDNAQPPEIVKTGFMDNIFGGRAADYISEINSAMNFTVVLQMLGIAVLLTLVSGAVSMLFVMRYEPLKILANRD